MKVINKYYLIEPEDSLDEIKYLINIGCCVLGYFMIGILKRPELFRLGYSRFGAELDSISFCKYEDEYFRYKNYYVKW